MRNVKEPRNRAERKRCPFTSPHPDEDRDKPPRGECAVCGRPLSKPRRETRQQFCATHEADDLRTRKHARGPPERLREAFEQERNP